MYGNLTITNGQDNAGPAEARLVATPVAADGVARALREAFRSQLRSPARAPAMR